MLLPPLPRQLLPPVPFCFLVIVLQFGGLGGCCSQSMSAPAPAVALAASSAAIAVVTAPVVTPPAPTPPVAFSPVDAAFSWRRPRVLGSMMPWYSSPFHHCSTIMLSILLKTAVK